MDVSIIIINYNTPQLVKQCVDSIFLHTANVDFEVIVVDNNSTDDSASILANDDRYTFVQSRQNLGFGKANNLGYKYTSGKYVFLLNSDTILLNNAIELFYNAMEKLPQNIACIGCKMIDAEGKPIKSIGIWQELTIKRILKSSLLSYFPFSKPMYVFAQNNYGLLDSENPFIKVDIVIGADLFIRRTVINELGLFDPRFFMYTEESDMQRTYLMNGFYSGIIVGPKIVHLVGKSAPSPNRKLMSTSGQFTYLKKWNHPFLYKLFRIAFFLLRFPITIIDWRYNWSFKSKYLKLLLSKTKDDSHRFSSSI